MSTRPKVRWGVLAFYVAALAFCLACWYGIAYFASEMFFKLNQGGI